jgi:uncharacterized cupin superfamily protein
MPQMQGAVEIDGTGNCGYRCRTELRGGETMVETPTKPAKSTVIDPATVVERRGSSYPPDLAPLSAGRAKQALGDAAGLTNFGVNLVRLPPGAWSSVRHWHSHEDEFVYVLEGEAVLVTDAGEQVLGPGMAAGFPAGVPDGHHLINRTDAGVTYLEVGARHPQDDCFYPDADLQSRHQDSGFTRKDGRPV